MAKMSGTYLERVNLALYGMTLEPAQKADLLQKYELMAAVMCNASDDSIVKDNLVNFEILFDKTLFLSVLCQTPRTELLDYKNITNMLNRMDSVVADGTHVTKMEKLHEQIMKKLAAYNDGMNTAIESKLATVDSVNNALATFGLESTDISEDEMNMLEVDEDDLGIDIDEILGDSEEYEIDIDNIEDDSVSSNADEDSVAEDDSKREAKEKITSMYGAQIKQTTDTLVKIFTAIYKSGFDAMPQEGILASRGDESPFIKINSSTHKPTPVTDQGSIYDYKIMKAFASMYPQLSRYQSLQDDKETVPTLEMMLSGEAVCHKFHLCLQSANIQYCTGKLSIRKWITETQLEKSGCTSSDEWIKKVNKGQNRLVSFGKMVQPWYRWAINNIITEYLLEAGVKSYADEQLANRVIEAINKNLRNIIVVAERIVGEKTDLKISTSDELNSQRIIDTLSDTLNISGNSSIVIKEIAHSAFEEFGVLTLSIMYDKEAANKANLFAYEIVDRLVESGNRPTWGHALLGKKEDGTYLFWEDFMGDASPSKRCYTIYAGSRSGKGVMTSTLIASALCDNKHVFYTDGKPENGATLGMIAWKEGKEAYVFDGQPEGKKPFEGYMENFSSGMREPQEIAAYLEKIPECLFANPQYFSEKAQKQFLGLMRYLKSMAFCAYVIEERASGILPSDDWQIWIFDEMTDMSRNEKKIREIFARYTRAKLGQSTPKSDTPEYYNINVDFNKAKTDEQKNDEGLQYIAKWVKWTSSIRHSFENASVISLGKANLNLIFIFQEATWIANDKKITTIGKIVSNLKSTKIVGRAALANACGEYGEGATQKTDWYSKVNAGNGWWAISNGADLRTCDVTLFKPYNVYTLPIDDASNIISDGASDDKKSKYYSKKYLAGYVDALLSPFGLNAADILSEAYQYADSAIQTLGYASSIKEFIYDCSNFASKDVDVSYENLRRELGDEDGDSVRHIDGISDTADFEFEDYEELDFGGPSKPAKKSEEELRQIIMMIISEHDTSVLSDRQIEIIVATGIKLLRSWGW